MRNTREQLGGLRTFLGLLLLAGCNGGGDSSPAATSTTVTGTAATGAAIAGATITIKDADGTTATATTGTDGSYSLDVTGMTPPFLVRVDVGGGSYLYSIGETAGTVNIHPLTDLIIRTWYEVQNTTIDAAFAGTGSVDPPSPTELSVIEGVVEQMVQSWLTTIAGIDPATFNLITSPFDADQTGFDHFLDSVTVNNGVVNVDTNDDGIVDYRATVTEDADSVDTTVEEDADNDGTFTALFSNSSPLSGSTANPYAGVWHLQATTTQVGAPSLCGLTAQDIGVTGDVGAVVIDASGHFVGMDADYPAYIGLSGTVDANGNLTITAFGDQNGHPGGGTCPIGTGTGSATNLNTITGTLNQAGDVSAFTFTRLEAATSEMPFAGAWVLTFTVLTANSTVCGENAGVVDMQQAGGLVLVDSAGNFTIPSLSASGSVSASGSFTLNIDANGGTCPSGGGTGTATNTNQVTGTFTLGDSANPDTTGTFTLTRLT
ncbi:MAG: hypothetical protein AB1451_15750 [Nitrospirota bacterium]